jgi:cytoskeletal protein RodZ
MSGGDSGAQAGSKIGRTLELARKERGFSLKEAEEATKIRAGYLAELERENFDVLPAVYVQGSLRTYANFLQLDGEAMVRELKRRQTPQEEHPYPLYVGPQEDGSLDDILTALGGAAGTKSRDATEGEEDKRPTLLPAGITGYLYLGSAVVLVLAVAALALTFAGDGRPSAVSQVREPLISQAPETSPPGIEENAQQPEREEEQSDEEEPRPERPAGSEAGNEEDEGGEQASQTGQNREEARPARNSASATAPAAAERDAERAPATAEPPRRDPASVRAPARQGSTAPPSSPRPTGQPGGAPSGGGGSPSPRGDGELEVRVAVGADDPVRLTGGPFDD